jgi:hypothetical protein
MLPLSSGATSYTFIEGLGTEYGPVYNIFPFLFESGFQLRCFTNDGLQPKCSPKILLPFGGGIVNVGPAVAPYFDNDTSCIPKLVGVSYVASSSPPILHPNPLGPSGMLMLSGSLSKSLLIITDVTGRKVAQLSVEGLTQVPISQYIHTAGTYYYRLHEVSTGQRHSGRFLYQ